MIFKLNYYIRIFLIGIISIVITSCTTQIDIDELDYFYVDRNKVLHINRQCKSRGNYAITPISRKGITETDFYDICSHCIEDEEYSYIKELIRIPTFLRGSTIEERQRDVYDYVCEYCDELGIDYINFNDYIDLLGSKEKRNSTYEIIEMRYGNLEITKDEFSELVYRIKEFSEAEILENQHKLYDYLRKTEVYVDDFPENIPVKIGKNIYEFRELLMNEDYRTVLCYIIRRDTKRPFLQDEAFSNAIYYNKYDEAFD